MMNKYNFTSSAYSGEMPANLEVSYKIAAYCRLSVEDGHGESNSISTQKEQIDRYVSNLGFCISEYFIDDGFSGTNFERPAFKRMIAQIEEKEINFVITKDLSRLGRNYIEAGRYTDIFFPSCGVRYVAINDNFDSLRGYDDLAPFKHILNDMYSKDLSKKMRSSKKIMMEQGKFCGSIPPYGYKKSKDKKNTLVPDETTAPNVKELFIMAESGLTNGKMAKIFNARGILTPAQYLHGLGLLNAHYPIASQKWTGTQIAKILCNPVYLGILVANRQKKISFRSGKCIKNDSRDFIVTENSHDPIVEEALFLLVQDIRHAKIHAKNSLPSVYDFETEFPLEHTREDLYYGLLKCGDCSSSLVLKKRGGNSSVFYTCSLYNRKGRSFCSGHYVDCDFLAAQLTDYLEKLKLHVHSKEFSPKILCTALTDERKRILVKLEESKYNLSRKTLQLSENQIVLKEKLNTDQISHPVYSILSCNCLAEKQKEKKNVDTLTLKLSELDKKISTLQKFIEFLPLFLDGETKIDLSLTRIIDKIEVYENADVAAQKRLVIHLKHIGVLNP